MVETAQDFNEKMSVACQEALDLIFNKLGADIGQTVLAIESLFIISVGQWAADNEIQPKMMQDYLKGVSSRTYANYTENLLENLNNKKRKK